MKRLITLAISCLWVLPVLCQVQNFVKTWEVKRPGVTDPDEVLQLSSSDARLTTEYRDGFGRPIQQVVRKGAPALHDVVTPVTYDEFGMVAKRHLPYVAADNDGAFQQNAFAGQEAFYHSLFPGEGYLYEEIFYDHTSLHRVLGQRKPGNHWGDNGRNTGSIFNYDGNVQKFSIGFLPGDLPVTSATTRFGTGSLVAGSATNEESMLTRTFWDFQGNMVLQEVQYRPILNEDPVWLSTYYVYDDFNRLRYVITPKAIEWLRDHDWNMTQSIADDLCYRYNYDSKGRMISSKRPGAGETEFVYDRRGRVVFTRSATDKMNDRWLAYLYDELDRVQTTGFIKTTSFADRSALQQEVDGLSVSAGPVPANVVFTALSFTYYDNYNFGTAQSFSSNYALQPENDLNLLPVQQSGRTLDMVTGRMDRVIDAAEGGNTFISGTFYYDEEGNCIQTIQDNYLGGKDIYTSQYNFSGSLKASCLSQDLPGTSILNFKTGTWYQHDSHGRTTALFKSYGGQPYHQLAAYSYDERGNMNTQILAPGYNSGQGLESMHYSHNLQGWLTGINSEFVSSATKSEQWSHYFGEILGYEEAMGLFSKVRSDGRITGAVWKSQGDNIPRKYNYDYTMAGLLKKADFSQNESLSATGWNQNRMDASAPVMEYDANRNITLLQQKGLLPAQTVPVLIDNLSYQYEADGYSNQLRAVTDDVGSGNLNGINGDFKKAENAPAQQYLYNADGSLVTDYGKEIDNNGTPGISYNILGKPLKIVIKDKYELNYVYDASGQLLARKIVNLGVTPHTEEWQYHCNGLVLYGYQPQYFINETGRLRVSKVANSPGASTPFLQIGGNNGLLIDGRPAFYDYYVSDHQGSVRVVLTEEEHVEGHLATMEITDAARKNYEETMFGKVNVAGQPDAGNELIATREDITPAWSSHYNDASNEKASRLNQTRPVGPNILLKVMAGDQVNLSVDYFYNETPVSGSNSLSDIASALVSAFTTSLPAVSNGAKDAASQLGSAFLDPAGALASYLGTPDHGAGNPSCPQAYLNWVFFDENFTVVDYDAGTGLGSGAARVEYAGDSHSLVRPGIKVPRNGYIFVYVSNVSSSNVWFDNLALTHERGRLMQEYHYYPYGLQIAGIGGRSYGKLDNYFRYQGAYSEFEEETGWNHFELRSYDPQLGRWLSIDPFDEFASGYVGMGGDPVNHVDINGGETDPLSNRLPDVTVIGIRSIKLFSRMLNKIMEVGKDVAEAATRQIASINAGLIAQTFKIKNAVQERIDDELLYDKIHGTKWYWRALDGIAREFSGTKGMSNAALGPAGVEIKALEEALAVKMLKSEVNAAVTEVKSVNQLNKTIQTGKAPRGIKRFDKGRGTVNLPQDEVHFDNGSSLYRDGTWRHDKGHVFTKEQIKFLKENGWNIPR